MRKKGVGRSGMGDTVELLGVGKAPCRASYARVWGVGKLILFMPRCHVWEESVPVLEPNPLSQVQQKLAPIETNIGFSPFSLSRPLQLSPF